MIVGVLALQGAFAKHVEMLSRLSCQPRLVLTAEELFTCNALIIPGGESTVLKHHIRLSGLQEPLLSFAKNKPIFGTCAGLILMANEGIIPLIEISVQRNAYGRQTDSFSTKLTLNLAKQKKEVEGIFIRAPKITEIHSPHIEVLATHQGVPVFVRQGHFFGATFHPELTNDPTIHQYFLESI